MAVDLFGHSKMAKNKTSLCRWATAAELDSQLVWLNCFILFSSVTQESDEYQHCLGRLSLSFAYCVALILYDSSKE
jgi:hypothetical protein